MSLDNVGKSKADALTYCTAVGADMIAVLELATEEAALYGKKTKSKESKTFCRRSFCAGGDELFPRRHRTTRLD